MFRRTFPLLAAALLSGPAVAQDEKAARPAGDTADVSKVATLIIEQTNEFRKATEALSHALDHAGASSAEEHARHFRDGVVPAMTALREVGDRIEQLVPHELWPLPTYREMLFTR